MISLVRTVRGLFFVVALILVDACVQSAEPRAAAAAAYAAAQAECIARASSRAEVDACRAAVRADAGLAPREGK